mmetsp:Transcript_17661/g.54845  ORF Transcript_17661/g.54845 Transcript_17661/m.54845 type:complete len:255 (+) Transcript_17661:1160-1924(+)
MSMAPSARLSMTPRASGGVGSSRLFGRRGRHQTFIRPNAKSQKTHVHRKRASAAAAGSMGCLARPRPLPRIDLKPRAPRVSGKRQRLVIVAALVAALERCRSSRLEPTPPSCAPWAPCRLCRSSTAALPTESAKRSRAARTSSTGRSRPRAPMPPRFGGRFAALPSAAARARPSSSLGASPRSDAARAEGTTSAPERPRFQRTGSCANSALPSVSSLASTNRSNTMVIRLCGASSRRKHARRPARSTLASDRPV